MPFSFRDAFPEKSFYNMFMVSISRTALLCLLCCLVCANVHAKHALTLFDTPPKYAPDFDHFDYVNPNAPKGGDVRMHYPITFDSLNPFILKGLPAPGINLVFETLMVPSLDEPQTYYPLVAKDVTLAEDKRSMRFVLDERARFHDGSKVTPEDIVFSLNILKEKGHPVYKLRYQGVERAEATGNNSVTFTFTSDDNRDLPFLVASLPVLSKAFYADMAFDDTSLTTPNASGPYRVESMDTGRAITYALVEDYWAADLPTRKGMFNFDTIRYDVYRDETVALEAFKAHEYDYREEYIARNWALSYQFDAVKDGRVVIDETPHKIPRGMQGFIFNTRKDKFSDRRVREAVGLTFDFQWMNRTLFYGAYERNNSLFQNTEFAARSLPSEEELALLEPYRDTLPPAVFSDVYQPSITDGTGYLRDNLIKADKLLKAAGWVVKNNVRVHEETGEPLTVEFLARQRTMERLVAAMKRNLRILGIDSHFRLVDESQYQKRWDTFDYDVTVIWWNRGLIFPGNEQTSYWACSQAEIQGGQNLSGYCNPATDALLKAINSASDEASLLHASRALDRIILHEHLIIPHFSISHYRMAYWDIFGIPETRPLYDRGFESWWIKQ